MAKQKMSEGELIALMPAYERAWAKEEAAMRETNRAFVRKYGTPYMAEIVDELDDAELVRFIITVRELAGLNS